MYVAAGVIPAVMFRHAGWRRALSFSITHPSPQKRQTASSVYVRTLALVFSRNHTGKRASWHPTAVCVIGSGRIRDNYLSIYAGAQSKGGSKGRKRAGLG